MAMTGTTLAAYTKNLNQFKLETAQAIAAGKNYGRTKMTTDIGAITTALGSDTTKRPPPMETPVQALQIGNDKSYFTNRVLHAVNKGKSSNITPVDMQTALTTALQPVLVPKNVDVPHVQGTGAQGSTLTCTMGIWTNAPTSYTYAWQRAGTPISGATAATYTVVAADSTKAVGCIVTGTNGAGSTAAPISNTVLCA